MVLSHEYVSLVGSRLQGFHWIRPNTVAQARCIACGDSKKQKNKMRFYFYFKNSLWRCFCHNCRYSDGLGRFVKRYAPDLYQQCTTSQHSYVLKSKTIDSATRKFIEDRVEKRCRECGEIRKDSYRRCVNYNQHRSWKITYKYARTQGRRFYAGKPCDGCADHCTKRRTDSRNCFHCDTQRGYLRLNTCQGMECHVCGFTLRYRDSKKCVYCSEQWRKTNSIRTKFKQHHCKGCGGSLKNGLFKYCQSCVVRNRERNERILGLMEMFKASNEQLRTKFKQPMIKDSIFQDVSLKGFEYGWSSDRSAYCIDKESGAGLWVPWQFLEKTDEEGNIAVPRWFALKELRNNPALAGLTGHRGTSDRPLIEQWLTEHGPEMGVGN